MVKNLPVMWETWVPSLGWEDPLEEGMATHSSTLAWVIPMDRGTWGAAVHGIAQSDTTEQLSMHEIIEHQRFFFFFFFLKKKENLESYKREKKQLTFKGTVIIILI